ncbi:hypothetical protein SKAU_G00048620 [Synaphobranchus kaupii]|uniref:Uncharacterized protein n=1 Tax=Synaphobranchus kaupii TaxID=118154 RepID=A0A9Q1J9J2_SYNKA|nr:hypothetical protein SKAU_G00048620 [Synaphobranchus kaupii]
MTTHSSDTCSRFSLPRSRPQLLTAAVNPSSFPEEPPPSAVPREIIPYLAASRGRPNSLYATACRKWFRWSQEFHKARRKSLRKPCCLARSASSSTWLSCSLPTITAHFEAPLAAIPAAQRHAGRSGSRRSLPPSLQNRPRNSCSSCLGDGSLVPGQAAFEKPL